MFLPNGVVLALVNGGVMQADVAYSLVHEGRRRRYLVHLPPAYDDRTPLPVVLAFHGGLGRAEVQRKQSGLNDVADRFGFAVVYPDGTGRTTMLTWNAGTCCGLAARTKVDDVGFVARMLDELPSRFAMDQGRVFSTGMSNGGMFSYRLACELSERITAVAPVAGDMGVDGPEPRRPVPLIHFHGLLDQNARFDGGLGSNQVEGVPHKSIRDGIAFWVRVNRCEPRPEVETSPDCVVERYRPKADGEGAPVELYILPNGGHTWPGGVDVTERFGTGPLIKGVTASTLMWEFFARQAPLAQPGGHLPVDTRSTAGRNSNTASDEAGGP